MTAAENPSHLSAALPYLDNSRPEVLAFVPAEACKILDVGCFQGAFGKTLKTVPRREVWGIEPHGPSADIAREALDRVLCSTIEDAMSQLPAAYFDLITFNDVLEHLAEPWDVLAAIRPLLATGGKVLASLPNIRHMPSLSQIVRHGDFPYADEGVFDRTHLRFFTAKSMTRMFKQSGYVLERQEGVNAITSWKFELVNKLLGGRFDDCRYLQIVNLAAPRI